MKRGKDMGKLATVVEILCTGDPLPERYRDHPLSGRYAGFRDCHIEPDWALLYRIEKNQLQLILVRMGTHSDLF